MPTLPTFDVNDAQAARIKNAYAPGLTNAEFADIFNAWKRQQVIKFVQQAELAQLRAQNRAEEQQVAEQVLESLKPTSP